MPRPPKRPPNRADGRYGIQRSFKKLTGSNKRKSFYSRISFEDCERQAKEYEAKLMAHRLVGDTLVSREATFKEWATTWLENYKEGKVKNNTYTHTYENTVNNHLIPFLGEMRIDLIQPLNIQEFVSAKRTVCSKSAMDKMRVCLNGIFETAIDNELCRRNPVKSISFVSKVPVTKKRTYLKAQVTKIYEFCKMHPFGLYIRLLLELGLRTSELCGLKWGDIDLKKRSVHIQRGFTDDNDNKDDKTKSQYSDRILPLGGELLKMLKENCGKPTEYVMTSLKNKELPITPSNFRKRRYDDFMEALVKEHKKIPVLNPHELRHTCGTLLYEKTKDIYAVSKYLGHASVDITIKLYVHESPELLRKALKIK